MYKCMHQLIDFDMFSYMRITQRKIFNLDNKTPMLFWLYVCDKKSKLDCRKYMSARRALRKVNGTLWLHVHVGRKIGGSWLWI